jgi:hypothetical protein
MGYSVGKWKGWLDVNGLPHSDALHITDRFTRINVGTLDIQITIDDPKSYRAPWTVTQRPRLFLDGELMESFCSENEKDTPHFLVR